LLLDVPAQRR